MWPSKKQFLDYNVKDDEICMRAKLSSNLTSITADKPIYLHKAFIPILNLELADIYFIMPYMHETALNRYFHWNKHLE